MPTLAEDKQLAVNNFRVWVDSLPVEQRNLPFIHVLGTSISPEDLLREMEADTAIGQAQTRVELRKIGVIPSTL